MIYLETKVISPKVNNNKSYTLHMSVFYLKGKLLWVKVTVNVKSIS